MFGYDYYYPQQIKKTMMMMMTMVVVVVASAVVEPARLCWPKLNDTRRTPVGDPDGNARQRPYARCRFRCKMHTRAKIVQRLVCRCHCAHAHRGPEGSKLCGRERARKLTSVCVCLRVFFSRTRTRTPTSWRATFATHLHYDWRCTHSTLSALSASPQPA